MPCASQSRYILVIRPFCEADGLVAAYSSRRMSVNLLMAGIDHESLKTRLIHQLLQQFFPVPLVAPAAEAPTGVFPTSAIWRQVPSRRDGAQNLSHGVDELAVVMSIAAPTSPLFVEAGLQICPHPIRDVMPVIIFRHKTLLNPVDLQIRLIS